jgi:hypothetical protein
LLGASDSVHASDLAEYKDGPLVRVVVIVVVA